MQGHEGDMDEIILPAFIKPSRTMQDPTAHLYVANCGPAVGITFTKIREVFEWFGPVSSIQPAGDSGSRVYVSYYNVTDAVAAREAWNSKPCEALHGRVMLMQHAVTQPQPSIEKHFPVALSSADLGVPGLSLYTDFVSPEEEQEVLRGVDARPWQTLARRRVQHYGYEFLYKTRNVDLSRRLGELPLTVEPVLRRISSLPQLTNAEEPSLPLDQLTINEYPRGVGLSPHIDTHSAFVGSIISLSLAGPCIMEFRKYSNKFDSCADEIPSASPIDTLHQDNKSFRNGELNEQTETISMVQKVVQPPHKTLEMERRALFLPQRSLLILSGEARYAWHHYIPHHKIDDINKRIVSRGSRRVSFTFRKVRSGPCSCKFPEHCNSQSPKVRATNSSSTSPSSTELHELRISESEEATKEADANDFLVLCAPTTSRNHDEDPQKPVEGLLKQFNSATPEIEKKYVHKVYDAIAPHFSATRFAKWPKVTSFLDSLEDGSIIADAGCGNGKYLGYNPKCLFIGCDISPPLIAICAQQGHEALVADALQLPYRTGFCDAGISIAVLHHLSNEKRRIRAIEELLRVVRRKGRVLFTVWAVEQEDKKLLTKWTPLTCKYMDEWRDNVGTKFSRSLSTKSLGSIKEAGKEAPEVSTRNETVTEPMLQMSENGPVDQSKEVQVAKNAVLDSNEVRKEEQQEYFVPWHLPYHRAEVGGASAAAVASGLARKDEAKRSVVYNRYYHCFVEGELERLASHVAGARIIDHFYDKSNWCVVIEKL